MNPRVIFKPQALKHLRGLPVRQQRVVTDRNRRHPIDNDPSAETRNKFRLRRESAAADYELRLGTLRVFYRIEGPTVLIAVIGVKRGNALWVEGEEIRL